MKSIDKIKELEEQIKRQKQLINNCKHDFEDAKYDSETYQEWVFTHYEGHGSDPYPAGYYFDKQKDKWSRECKICGKKEYTYEQEPVEYQPKFK